MIPEHLSWPLKISKKRIRQEIWHLFLGNFSFAESVWVAFKDAPSISLSSANNNA
jgi:hypothetical protein